MKRSVRVFLDTLKQFSVAFLLLVLLTVTDTVIFWLYGIVKEPLIYSALVCTSFVLTFFIIKYLLNVKASNKIEQIKNSDEREWARLLEPHTLAESDYHMMIGKLDRKLDELTAAVDSDRQEMLDYYTGWVHQIKTPISVMRLDLMSNDTKENRELLSELFRIERYVDMVLQYIRLGSPTNDLLIKNEKLDDIIRECIRKYASQFIASKVRVIYDGTDKEVVTDRKWLSVIIEQILSNAVKYAPEGTVEITVTDDLKLIIKDNGIGISKEDLPRIFEKGYTGNNGRLGKNSSGLGLYLTKKAADKIQVPVTVESELTKGTSFILDLKRQDMLYD